MNTMTMVVATVDSLRSHLPVPDKPQKRERRPAGNGTAHLDSKTGQVFDQDYSWIQPFAQQLAARHLSRKCAVTQLRARLIAELAGIGGES